jgi:hypothetical protein
MFLSKIWFFLVAVFAVLAATLLILQPRPMQGELDAQVEARLQGADRGAGMLLKIHARKWLDAAAQVSSDAQLYEALDQATRGGANLDLVHKTAQARLRYFNQEWKTDQLIAVDGKGRVVARTGIDENVWKDDISGEPVVAEALRGYRLDDTWDVSNKIYRVTASPVIAHDKYVGALLVVQEIGSDLAGRIHDTLGVDVAFLVRDQVASQSTSLPILGELPALVKKHAAELAEKGHSDPIPLKGGDRSYIVVAAPLAGEAASHDASYVLVAERPLATSISTTLAALSPSMMSGKDLGTLGGGLAIALAIGFLLMTLEHDRPVKRLLRALQTLSRGESARLDDTRHPGKFGAMGRAVNATLDRQTAPAQAERSMDSILGPPRGGRAIDLAPPGPAPFVPPFVPPAAPPPPFVPPAAPPPPAFGSSPNDQTPSIPQAPYIPDTPKLPEVEPPRADPFREPPTRPQARPLPPPSPAAIAAADAFDSPATVLDNAAAASLGGSMADEESTSVSTPSLALLEQSSRSVPTMQTPTPGDEAEFHNIFQQFIDTKRTCGEPTEGVTYDKFVIKLRQNRDQLMSRYACKAVKFQVYVKDGKAALKATPIAK